MSQTAAQWARDEITKGVDPNTEVTFESYGVPYITTLEEAAEMAFIGDIIDREMPRIMKEVDDEQP